MVLTYPRPARCSSREEIRARLKANLCELRHPLSDPSFQTAVCTKGVVRLRTKSSNEAPGHSQGSA